MDDERRIALVCKVDGCGSSDVVVSRARYVPFSNQGWQPGGGLQREVIDYDCNACGRPSQHEGLPFG